MKSVLLPFHNRSDLQLFSTVFHVWGKLNRTFDATPQGDNLQDYFGQYVKWSDPSQPNYLQVRSAPVRQVQLLASCVQEDVSGLGGGGFCVVGRRRREVGC